MKPPFPWFGSKTALAADIVAMLPEHAHYVEVFAGSAAVLFAKPRSRLETLNDLDGNVVNLFAVLRDPALAGELAELITLTPYARDEFAAAVEPTTDPLERARRFLVRVRMSMGRDSQVRSGWSYNVNKNAVSSAKVARWVGLPDRLRACAERLIGVQVESLDWREVLTRYDGPGVCMFIDPPYHPDVRAKSLGMYHHEMTPDDHGELLAALTGLSHATAVVTHYEHPAYNEALAGWDHVDIASHADNVSAGRQDARIERVWTSHPVAARLFDGGAL